MEAVKAELARSVKLQREIWALAVSSSREAGTAQAPMLLLPALNAMFDITTTDGGRDTSSAADYLRNARCADSRVFVVRGLRDGGVV
jgi:hypothetical protein